MSAPLGSLRAELVGVGPEMRIPAFAVLLPAGWARGPVGHAAWFDVIDEAARALPEAARAGFIAMTRRSLAQQGARVGEVIATFTPRHVDPDEFVPMSIAVARFTPPGGATIDATARGLVDRRGAEPMDDNASVLRWVERSIVGDDGGSVEALYANYLIRVPGAASHALLARAIILVGAEEHRVEQESLALMVALADGIIASIRWRRDG